MADSVRKRILKNLVDTVAAVNEVMQARLGTSVAKRSDPKPRADVIPVNDARQREAPSNEYRTLTAAIRIAVDETHQEAGWEFEDLEGIIEKAVLADHRRGGLAQDTRSVGTVYLYLNPEQPIAGGDLMIEVDYKRSRTDPTVLG